MTSALLLLTFCLHTINNPQWLTGTRVITCGGGGGGSHTTTLLGALPGAPGAGGSGNGSGTSPGAPPPPRTPDQAGGCLYAHSPGGRPGTNGPGSPLGEGTSPGSG